MSVIMRFQCIFKCYFHFRVLNEGLWHQNQTRLAIEKRQQQKANMLHVLEEADLNAEINELRKKYNDEAVNNWLDRHNLSRATTADGTPRNSCQEINKITDEKPNTGPEMSEERESSQSLHTKQGWNPCNRVPEKKYVSILPDFYPRDPYTMLPSRPSTRDSSSPSMRLAKADNRELVPKFHYENLTFDELKELTQLLGFSNNLKKPVFRSKYIIDVEKRRKCSIDKLPRHEVPLHITNDVRSATFQRALLTTTVSKVTN